MTYSVTVYLFRNDGGDEVEPQVWHELLANSSSEKTLVLDCRNDYESEMGSFQGSTSLDTSTFSETWTKLDKILEGKVLNLLRPLLVLTHALAYDRSAGRYEATDLLHRRHTLLQGECLFKTEKRI